MDWIIRKIIIKLLSNYNFILNNKRWYVDMYAQISKLKSMNLSIYLYIVSFSYRKVKKILSYKKKLAKLRNLFETKKV